MNKKKRKAIGIGMFLFVLVLLIFLIFILNSNKQESEVDRAIRLGGEWFLNNQNNNFLIYEYDIQKEIASGSHSVREMGGFWAVTALEDYTGDSRYNQLEMKGFEYFKRFFSESRDGKTIIINITPESKKIAYSAFMILAISNMDIDRKNEYMEKIGNGLLLQQREDGSLITYFNSNQNSGIDYYPGESLFALMVLYNETRETKYLEAVQKAFPYYADYWRNNKNTAFVPWHSRADSMLYKETKNDEVANFIFEMNDWMIKYHKPLKNCSEFSFSKGIVIAAYMEGVNAAYEIAKDTGDKERMKCYENFVKEGTKAILKLQVLPEENLSEQAIGGFKGNTHSTTLRVDRNQHAVMALMDAKAAGILK
jgi:hypothetical protein